MLLPTPTYVQAQGPKPWHSEFRGVGPLLTSKFCGGQCHCPFSGQKSSHFVRVSLLGFWMFNGLRPIRPHATCLPSCLLKVSAARHCSCQRWRLPNSTVRAWHSSFSLLFPRFFLRGVSSVSVPTIGLVAIRMSSSAFTRDYEMRAGTFTESRQNLRIQCCSSPPQSARTGDPVEGMCMCAESWCPSVPTVSFFAMFTASCNRTCSKGNVCTALARTSDPCGMDTSCSSEANRSTNNSDGKPKTSTYRVCRSHAERLFFRRRLSGTSTRHPERALEQRMEKAWQARRTWNDWEPVMLPHINQQLHDALPFRAERYREEDVGPRWQLLRW